MVQSDNTKEAKKQPCPCCKYLTLDGSGNEVCLICGWEDDGQNDPYADVINGGPNGNLSLTQARYNFARIGATSWYWLEFPEPDLTITTPRDKVVHFSEVPQLSGLPAIDKWNNPNRVLSSHLRDDDLLTRWAKVVRFILDHGFIFQGTYGYKDHKDPNWTSPSSFIRYDHDQSKDIVHPIQNDGTIIVEAWFERPDADGGIRIYYEDIWEMRERSNEPSIDIEMHLESESYIQSFFDELILKMRPVIAACSYIHGGIGPLNRPYQHTFWYADVFYSSNLARPDDLDALNAFYGQENIIPIGDGLKCLRDKTLKKRRKEFPKEANSMEYNEIGPMRELLSRMLTRYLGFPVK
jgi:hypothetical protein